MQLHIFLMALTVPSMPHLVTGQPTDSDPESCTYSFVVPQTDLMATCQAYSQQQVHNLQQQIADLKDQVHALQASSLGMDRGSGRGNPKDLSKLAKPSFSCQCDSTVNFTFSVRDCQDVASLMGATSGVYEITPINSTGQLLSIAYNQSSSSTKYWVVETNEPVQVPCQIEDDIGWTLLMRRSTFDVSFNKSWEEYRNGFGNLTDGGDFWLGLETMHQLTNQLYHSYVLWVKLIDQSSVPHIYPYQGFRVLDENSHYTLVLEKYTGALNDNFMDSQGKQFITYDKDRDTHDSDTSSSRKYSAQCPTNDSGTGGGGWWFSSYLYHAYHTSKCGSTNLNALKPYWGSRYGSSKAYKSVEMRMRPSK